MGPWSLKGVEDLNGRLTATDLVCSASSDIPFHSVMFATRHL